jgi:methionyl aminopeptidase
MVLAVEPMVNAGTYEVEVLEDGWAVATRDRKRSAHFEHTIVIRDDAAEVLTG